MSYGDFGPSRDTAKILAMCVRNTLEDIHDEIPDATMAKINQRTRDAIYTGMRAMVNYQWNAEARSYVNLQHGLIPDYWEPPELLEPDVETVFGAARTKYDNVNVSRPVEETEPATCRNCGGSSFHVTYLLPSFVRVDALTAAVTDMTVDSDGAQREWDHVVCDPTKGGCGAEYGGPDPIYQRVIATGDGAEWPRPRIAWMEDSGDNIFENPVFNSLYDDEVPDDPGEAESGE